MALSLVGTACMVQTGRESKTSRLAPQFQAACPVAAWAPGTETQAVGATQLLTSPPRLRPAVTTEPQTMQFKFVAVCNCPLPVIPIDKREGKSA